MGEVFAERLATLFAQKPELEPVMAPLIGAAEGEHQS